MKDKIKMAVIGLRMGAGHGRRILDDENADLVAVCDINNEQIDKVFKSYVEEAGVAEADLPNRYDDMKDLFANEELDAVLVCLPTGLHDVGCKMAAENGVHVLCDKPLDVNIDKCNDIIDSCEKAGVRLGVIYPMHFQPRMAGVKKAIDDGLVGDLLMVDIHMKWLRDQEYYDKGGWRGTWKMDGGGSLMNQGAHPVDYLCWLCGEPDEIVGDYGALNHKIETEDWAMGVIRFKNGCRGSIMTTTNVSPDISMTRVEVHGTKDSIMIDERKVDGEKQIVISAPEGVDIEELGKRDFDYPIGQFTHALRNDLPFEVNGKKARDSVAVITGVYKSANEGKRIKI